MKDGSCSRKFSGEIRETITAKAGYKEKETDKKERRMKREGKKGSGCRKSSNWRRACSY